MAAVKVPGDQIRSEAGLHAFLARELDFGPFYGRNLAAMRDRLLTDVERPMHLIWKESDASRSALGNELWARIIAIFDQAVAQDEGYGWTERFTYELV